MSLITDIRQLHDWLNRHAGELVYTHAVAAKLRELDLTERRIEQDLDNAWEAGSLSPWSDPR